MIFFLLFFFQFHGHHRALHCLTHPFPTRRSSVLLPLTPLTYLGGVFYSIQLLPGWAQALTHANPIFYMVNAFRYGLLGTSDVPLWVAYALMLGFMAAL